MGHSRLSNCTYCNIQYLIFKVTENTAIILDECGILTTNRGETFVKGAGYVKTYFVPLDENFNLIKKKNSMDFYRIEDRSRYFAVRASRFSDTSNSSSVYGYSAFDIRRLSFNSAATDDSLDTGHARTATPVDDPMDNPVYGLMDNRANVPVVGQGYDPVEMDDLDVTSVSAESEVKETRCWRTFFF